MCNNVLFSKFGTKSFLKWFIFEYTIAIAYEIVLTFFGFPEI